jgi:tetratricopeptide (TPR) repeat protein
LDPWVSEELESLSESTDTPLKQKWLAAVRKYAASRPTDSSAQILLGDSQTILRDYKTAANSYEKVIKLNTDPLMKAKGFARLGLTYFSMDEFEIASRYLGEALLTKPDDVFALKYQGLAYFKLKQFPRARDILKRASQMGPDESSIAFWLGTTYVELRDYDKAINALLQAQRSKSQYAPAETNVELGKAYLALKRYPSAVAAFQNAIKQKQAIEKSEYPRAYFFLGVTYAWMGRKAEAHQMYQKLLPIDPEGAKSLLVEINSKP